MESKRAWRVCLIHHSHTDIGYTERQDKIMRYHYDFIRQAMDILDEAHGNREEEYQGFVWQCENYWQIANFYEMADEKSCKKLEHYLSTGEIGLSGNYLNMTELVSRPALDEALNEMEAYGARIGHPITAGMCADINGMSWGYGDALYEHGVRYFYSALHTHHGMFPLYRKMMPFYWETPGGNRLLVWNGDHYQLGNDLFLAPLGGASYMTGDEYAPLMEQHLILNKNRRDTESAERVVLKKRIERYLDNLEEEGYPYGIVPITISGVPTDNAPPSRQIARRVRELNQVYGGRITFEMVNLEQFFGLVEENCADIPTYGGDWPDWWGDGVGSTPREVKLYREAVRKYDICRKLDPDRVLGDEELMHQSVREQMLFAEHTWGYSSSVSEPWESLVGSLELKKGSYAVNANSYTARNLDRILEAKGEVSIRHDRPQVYTVCNPHDQSLYTKVYLYIELWEYVDGVRYDGNIPIRVVDCATGTSIPCQVTRTARAFQVEIEILMQAKEERVVKIRRMNQSPPTILNHACAGAEGVEDLLLKRRYRHDEDEIETDYFLIKTKEEAGICSILYKPDRTELMRSDAGEGAFGGIYEISDLEGDPCETRRRMGRNRKSKAARRYRGVLRNRAVLEEGEIYTALQLDYQLEGTGEAQAAPGAGFLSRRSCVPGCPDGYTLVVKVYRHQPKLEVMVRIQKETRLEPENLYVSLPFTAGKETTVYLDKTGCIIRPGYDQLPGTCQDFYLIQNAVLFRSGKRNVAVIAKDAPLVKIGRMEAGPVELCSRADQARNQSPVYSWPMNNFWETNFKADLGGFYEFAYTLLVDEEKSPAEIYRICEAENEGLLAFGTLPESL